MIKPEEFGPAPAPTTPARTIRNGESAAAHEERERRRAEARKVKLAKQVRRVGYFRARAKKALERYRLEKRMFQQFVAEQVE